MRTWVWHTSEAALGLPGRSPETLGLGLGWSAWAVHQEMMAQCRLRPCSRSQSTALPMIAGASGFGWFFRYLTFCSYTLQLVQLFFCCLAHITRVSGRGRRKGV